MNMALPGTKIHLKSKGASVSFMETVDSLIKGSTWKEMMNIALSGAKIHWKYKEATGSFMVT